MHTIGIDFGTTKTLVARINQTTQWPTLIRLGRGTESIPTSVFIEDNGKMFFGEEAEDKQSDANGIYLRGFKMRLGSSIPLHIFHSNDEDVTQFTAFDIVRSYLNYVYNKIHKLVFSGEEEIRAIITQPVNFTPVQSHELQKAAIEAGFVDVTLISEPEAAGLAYCKLNESNSFHKHALIVDWGGGTLDIATIKNNENTVSTNQEMAEGDSTMGGEIFDDKLWNYVVQELNLENNRRIEHIYHLPKIRKAKERLSFEESITLRLSSQTGPYPPLTITQTIFNNLIKEQVILAAHKIKQLIEKIPVNNKPETIILVGGTNQIPFIKSQLKSICKLPISEWEFSREAVALGAILWAKMNTTQNNNLSDFPTTTTIKPHPAKTYNQPINDLLIPISLLKNAKKHDYEIAPVRLYEIIEHDDFKCCDYKLPIALGKTDNKSPLVIDLVESPHILIGGNSGSGKSVCLHNIILSLIFKNHPDNVRIILADFKGIDMQLYKRLPHLAFPVISNTKHLIKALEWIINESTRRRRAFVKEQVRTLHDYNNTVTHKLPYIIIIIDDIDGFVQETKENIIDKSLRQIITIARTVGIHIIISSQNPKVDIISGFLKSNIPCRIAFSVANSTISNTIINSNKASKLIGNGNFIICNANGTTSQQLANGAYTPTSAISSVTKHWTTLHQQTFISNDSDSSNLFEDISFEETFTKREPEVSIEKYIKFVISEKCVNSSLLQRRFSIGYARATRLIQKLQECGVINTKINQKGYYECMVGFHSDKLKHLTDSLTTQQNTEDDKETALTFDNDRTNLQIAYNASPDDMHSWGEYYSSGKETEINESYAFEWFYLAAQQGHTNSQYRVAECLLNGIGTIKNEFLATQWYYNAAICGHIEAQYKLGICYEKGIGTDVNIEHARYWYTQAAQQNYQQAIMALTSLK